MRKLARSGRESVQIRDGHEGGHRFDSVHTVAASIPTMKCATRPLLRVLRCLDCDSPEHGTHAARRHRAARCRFGLSGARGKGAFDYAHFRDATRVR
jgi:hypothetical protein